MAASVKKNFGIQTTFPSMSKFENNKHHVEEEHGKSGTAQRKDAKANFPTQIIL